MYRMCQSTADFTILIKCVPILGSGFDIFDAFESNDSISNDSISNVSNPMLTFDIEI